MIWAFLLLAGVLLTKYYTESTARGLRAKAREEQKVLADARHSLAGRQERLAEVEKEEKEVKARLDRIQALIADVQIEINESVSQARKAEEAETDSRRDSG